MKMSPLVVLILASTLLALLLLLAISLRNLNSLSLPESFVQQSDTSEKVYEDEDGTATAETQQAYSVKTQKRSLLLLAVINLSLTIALAILGTLNDDATIFLIRRWMSAVLWVWMTPSLQ